MGEGAQAVKRPMLDECVHRDYIREALLGRGGREPTGAVWPAINVRSDA